MADSSDDKTQSAPTDETWNLLQAKRARRLLEAARREETDREFRFVLLVGAVHLARGAIEHWYRIADLTPISAGVIGKEADGLRARIRTLLEEVFCRTPWYELITSLREWDYHSEPLLNPEHVGPNLIYGRGAPMVLTTGPNKNSSAVLVGGAAGFDLHTTGSAKRIGRTNHYRMRGGCFLDPVSGQAVRLEDALAAFLDALPARCAEAATLPEVRSFFNRCGE